MNLTSRGSLQLYGHKPVSQPSSKLSRTQCHVGEKKGCVTVANWAQQCVRDLPPLYIPNNSRVIQTAVRHYDAYSDDSWISTHSSHNMNSQRRRMDKPEQPWRIFFVCFWKYEAPWYVWKNTWHTTELQLSGSPIIRISNYPDLQLSWSPIIRISNYPDLQLSWSPIIRISNYPDLQLSGTTHSFR